MQYSKRLLNYRQLIWTLMIREFKGVFAQTALGWLWLLTKPLLVLGVFTIFFDHLLDLDTGAVPYPVFAFAGLSLWYFFSNLINSTGNALQQSTHLMQKVYFPRLAILIAKSALSVLEFLIHLIIMLILALIYGYKPEVSWILIFPIALLIYLTGFTVGIWMNNLSIRYRDLQHLVPQVVNVAIWLTPVFYPLSIVPKGYHDTLYLLNPIATSIDALRFALFDLGDLPRVLWINSSLILLLLGVGIFTFIRKERYIIDKL